MDQELILTGGFTATGSGGDGAVRLLGARGALRYAPGGAHIAHMCEKHAPGNP